MSDQPDRQSHRPEQFYRRHGPGGQRHRGRRQQRQPGPGGHGRPGSHLGTANLPANATNLTIAGYGFDTNQANDSVTFDNGVTGTVTSAS